MVGGLVPGTLVALLGAFVSLVWLPSRAELDETEVHRMEEVYAGHHPHEDSA